MAAAMLRRGFGWINLVRTLCHTKFNNPTNNAFVHRNYVNYNIIRPLSSGLNAFSQPLPEQNDHVLSKEQIDRTLARMDRDIHRTGRISKREIEDILGEIKVMRSASTTQSLMMIRCCGNLVPEEKPEVRTQLVHNIWDTLQSLKVPLDISHYNALLRVYLENEFKFCPLEFLADLESKGLEPNRVTYQRLVMRYCQDGDISGATKVLEYMKEKQHPVNASIFNALILGHSRANDMDSARGILKMMTQAGLEPDGETYTTLMVGYAGTGNMEAIREVLSESKEVMVYDQDYLEIVHALAISGYDQYVDEILSKANKMTGYNQVAINVIYRLINAGCDETAYKILKTMNKSTRGNAENVGTTATTGSQSSGDFFIAQMVRANRPVNQIVVLCKRLQDDGLNSGSFSKAAESAIMLDNVENSVALMHALAESGLPIRPHYFWPLIMQSKTDADVYYIVQSMLNMGTQPTLETIREYIVPKLQGKPEAVLRKLRQLGITPPAVVGALITQGLLSGSFRAALSVAHFSPVQINGQLRRSMIDLYLKTSDAQSFVKLLHVLCNCSSMQGADSRSVIDSILLDLCSLHQGRKPEVILSLLEALLDEGLGMTNSAATQIQGKLADTMTTGIGNLLEKLTADLEPVPVQSFGPQTEDLGDLNNKSEEELENLLIQLAAERKPRWRVQSQLLHSYCRNHNLEKAEPLMQEMEASGFTFQIGLTALLTELYAIHGKIDEAVALINKQLESDPTTRLHPVKVLRVVTGLVEAGRVEEAITLLEKQRQPELSDGMQISVASNNLCWRILNNLSDGSNQDAVTRVLNALIDNNYAEANSVTLYSSVKVHLNKSDTAAAVAEFENCVKNQKITPCKNELMVHLIQNDDATNLQKVMDLSTELHGEMNSLFDLLFAFLDCGRVKQARRVIETPGLRAKHQKLEYFCRRYVEERRVEELENLVEITKDLFDVDRNVMYMYLLQAYAATDNVEKALGVWTSLQEEDVQPSDELLVYLANILRKHNQNVPFVVPEITQSVNTIPLREVNREKGDVDRAWEKQGLGRGQGSTNIIDKSLYIESALRAGHLGEASSIASEMLLSGSHPLPRVMVFLFNKLAAVGDFETMEQFAEKLTEDVKRKVSFDNRLCNAYLNAGKSAEYLDRFISAIDSATDEELPALKSSFPRGGAYGIIEREPATLEKFVGLTDKYASRGIYSPANVLWMYYLINNENDKARQVWDSGLKNSTEIGFRHVCSEARENQNETLVENLFGYVKESRVNDAALGIVYSCWLDVLCSKNKFDEGLQRLEVALKDITLADFNSTALKRVKEGLEKTGKSFPYTIPAKVPKSESSSSSSSDSDDERTLRK